MSILGNPVTTGGGDPFLGGIYVRNAAVAGKRIGKLKADNNTYFSAVDADGNELKLNTSQPFEVGMVVRFSDVRQQVCCLTGALESVVRAPSIALDTNGTNIVFAISTNGNQWASLLPVFPSGYAGIPVDTDIFFRMAWDGTSWSGLVDDGNRVMTNSTPLGTPYYSASDPMRFATQGSQGSYVPQNAWYDMRRLYMKQNGILIWGCGG